MFFIYSQNDVFFNQPTAEIFGKSFISNIRGNSTINLLRFFFPVVYELVHCSVPLSHSERIIGSTEESEDLDEH